MGHKDVSAGGCNSADVGQMAIIARFGKGRVEYRWIWSVNGPYFTSIPIVLCTHRSGN